MIISLRGTSGSGKSTLVRKITALYEGSGEPFHVSGRRKVYYTVWTRGAGVPLMVPGHYEIANGGIDTLKTLQEAYDLAEEFATKGHDILMEGKCMSDGVPHVLGLKRAGLDVRVVHVMESTSRCLKSVRERGHGISFESIERTHAKVMRDMEAIKTSKIDWRQTGRDECFSIVRHWLAL